MKKILAILLALIVMLSFAACGADKADDDADIDDKIEENDNGKDDDDDEDKDDDADADADADAGATEDADVDAGATADEETTADVDAGATGDNATESKNFSIGKFENGVYANDFTGWRIAFNSEWTVTAGEALKAHNLIGESVTGDAYVKAVENANSYYDMTATHSNGMDNINLVVGKLGKSMTIAEIKTELEGVYKATESSFISMGYTNLQHEISTQKIDGKEIAALVITAEINGFTMKQVTFLESIGEYMLSCSITVVDENNLNYILGAISFK